MSWNEQQVIAALSHSEMAVRDRALETLGAAYPNSTEAMPAVIRAIDQYGWQDTFASLYPAYFLPQSSENIAWAWKHLLEGIAGEGKDEPWFCYDLACLIAYAHPSARNRSAEEENLGKLRASLAAILVRPIELAELSDDDLWQRFETDTKQWDEAKQSSRIEVVQLGIALGARGERFAPQLTAGLKVNEAGDVLSAGRVATIALGVARYTPAIGAILDYLRTGDAPFGMNLSELALAKIGGPEVLAALQSRIEDVEYVHDVGARLFGLLPGEESLVAGLKLLESMHDDVKNAEDGVISDASDIAADLADALLYHFDPRAIEPAAQTARELLRQDYQDDILENAIGVNAELLGVELAERAAWFEQATEEATVGRLREVEDEGLSVVGNNVFYEGFDATNLPASPSIALDPYQMPRRRRRLMPMRPTPDPESGTDQRLIPIRRPDAPIGRNDRCPCGSGKKYKNCCFRKV